MSVDRGLSGPALDERELKRRRRSPVVRCHVIRGRSPGFRSWDVPIVAFVEETGVRGEIDRADAAAAESLSRVALPDERDDMPRWLWIVIIVILVLLVLGYFMRGRRGAV